MVSVRIMASLWLCLLLSLFSGQTWAAPTYEVNNDLPGHASHKDHSRSPVDLRLHDLRRIVHLRDRVDRMHLQQLTDRLRLDNLEKVIQEMQQQQLKEQPSSLALSRHSGTSVNGVLANDPQEASVTDQERAVGNLASDDHHEDEDTSQEIPSSPIHMGQKTESLPITDAPGLTSTEENQQKTVLWLKEEVISLQELVQDLGKSCNVTVAMHDKQEVEARLGGLGEGLAILQGGLSRASVHGQATEALLNTLREEERTTIHEVQQATARLAGVEREMVSLKEDLYDTLASLPDGSLTNQNTPETVAGGELDQISTNNSTASKKVSGRLSTSINPSTFRVGLSGVQQSSLQLLQAVDALETRQDTDTEQLRTEIAKLEFNVSKSNEEHHEELRRYHDGIKTEQNLSAELRRLTEVVEAVTKDLQEKSAKQTDTDYRLESVATRFFEFENRVKSVIGTKLENQVPSHGARSEQSTSSPVGVPHRRRLASRRRNHRQGLSHRRHPHVLRERVRGERY